MSNTFTLMLSQTLWSVDYTTIYRLLNLKNVTRPNRVPSLPNIWLLGFRPLPFRAPPLRDNIFNHRVSLPLYSIFAYRIWNVEFPKCNIFWNSNAKGSNPGERRWEMMKITCVEWHLNSNLISTTIHQNSSQFITILYTTLYFLFSVFFIAKLNEMKRNKTKRNETKRNKNKNKTKTKTTQPTPTKEPYKITTNVMSNHVLPKDMTLKTCLWQHVPQSLQ